MLSRNSVLLPRTRQNSKEFLRFLNFHQVGDRLTAQIDDLDVNLINLEDLKLNKRASRRLKDLLDLENLP
jgi:hypothetical protein